MTVIKETEINIDGAIINSVVKFDYFTEYNELIIVIESIKVGDIEVIDLVTTTELENIKTKCELELLTRQVRRRIEEDNLKEEV